MKNMADTLKEFPAHKGGRPLELCNTLMKHIDGYSINEIKQAQALMLLEIEDSMKVSAKQRQLAE
jgi:hypothetical protein